VDPGRNLQKELENCQLGSDLAAPLPRWELVALSHTLFVCTTCKRAAGDAPLGPGFIDALGAADLPSGMAVVGTACMSNCARPLSVALAAPGKATYMLAEIDPAADLEPLVELAKLYVDKPDGQTKLLERPKAIRRKIIARVPAIPAEF
jgi:predicted metal-binding protein